MTVSTFLLPEATGVIVETDAHTYIFTTKILAIMASEGQAIGDEEESSEEEDNLSDKEKEEETETNPNTWATTPLIGFFLSLNTSWHILPRLKAIGGQFNLFYLVL